MKYLYIFFILNTFYRFQEYFIFLNIYIMKISKIFYFHFSFFLEKKKIFSMYIKYNCYIHIMSGSVTFRKVVLNIL